MDSAEVWPVSINDVEIEEEDEVGELSEQSLGFAQIRGAEPVRTGITVEVSNMAIDSAGFDLLSYVHSSCYVSSLWYHHASVPSPAPSPSLLDSAGLGAGTV